MKMLATVAIYLQEEVKLGWHSSHSPVEQSVEREIVFPVLGVADGNYLLKTLEKQSNDLESGEGGRFNREKETESCHQQRECNGPQVHNRNE